MVGCDSRIAPYLTAIGMILPMIAWREVLTIELAWAFVGIADG
jgi:hypothetical protein